MCILDAGGPSHHPYSSDGSQPSVAHRVPGHQARHQSEFVDESKHARSVSAAPGGTAPGLHQCASAYTDGDCGILAGQRPVVVESHHPLSRASSELLHELVGAVGLRLEGLLDLRQVLEE